MKKQLGFWSVLSLVMGNMIGVGIFVMPSVLAPFGSLSLIGWGATLLGALFLALMFSRISTLFPSAGGPYAYARAGLGDFIGFQTAWTYWVSLWIGSVATIVSTIGYLSLFFPTLMTDRHVTLGFGLFVVWGLTLINLVSISLSGRFQIVMTVLKILPLVLLFFFGLPHVEAVNFSVFNPSGKPAFMAFIEVMTLTMWAFIGVESATIPSDYVENPKRNIPLGTFWGTLLVGLVYIGISSLVIGIVPNTLLQNVPAPFALAAQIIFGPKGALLVAATAVIAAVGSLNGWFLIQAQIPMAAALDGLFPHQFGKTDKRGVPAFGLILSGLLMSLLLVVSQQKTLVQTFQFMITLGTLSILLTYLFSALSELVFYVERPQTFRKKNLLKVLCLAIPTIIYILFAIYGAGRDVITWGSLLFFGSAPLYVLVRFQKYRSLS